MSARREISTSNMDYYDPIRRFSLRSKRNAKNVFSNPVVEAVWHCYSETVLCVCTVCMFVCTYHRINK